MFIVIQDVRLLHYFLFLHDERKCNVNGPNILICPQSLENMTSIYCLGGYGLNRNFDIV